MGVFRQGRISVEEYEQMRLKQVREEWEWVDCNVNKSYNIRPDWPKGKIRDLEKDSYVVRVADRKDMWGGDGDEPVMLGNFHIKFFNKQVWKKGMESEERVPGSFFAGKSHKVLHDPTKKEEKKPSSKQVQTKIEEL